MATDASAPARERFDRLTTLSPSAKLVFWELTHAGEPLDYCELAERTLLPKRTVRYALNILGEAELVEARPCLTDARKHVYTVKAVERPD